MDTVVCYVCGTSYPEDMPQCPTCGFIQNAELYMEDDYDDASFTYEKGGRFSKSNVRKRNQAKILKAQSISSADNMKRKSIIATVILITVLLQLILLVGGYILLRFFIPNNFLYEGLENLSVPFMNQKSDKDDAEVPLEDYSGLTQTDTANNADNALVSSDCTEVILQSNTLIFTTSGTSFALQAELTPSNTSDIPVYMSSDPAVATVSETGVVTSVSGGMTVITVSCGLASDECTVVCDFDDAYEADSVVIDMTMNQKEIALSSAGQCWMLYSGSIPIQEIAWSSDDNNVATFTNGVVTAVGEGTTEIHAAYNNQTVSCTVHCVFNDHSSLVTE